MTTFNKNYIGKGTQVDNYDIVKVVIPVDKLEGAIFEREGIKYLSFEIAKMKQADKFNRTHTCYYTTKQTDEKANKAPEKQQKSDKKKKKKQGAEDDLPF